MSSIRLDVTLERMIRLCLAEAPDDFLDIEFEP